jgi:hypothetical protein
VDVIIATLRLQFKDAINIAMTYMMFKSNNQVTNIRLT